LSELRAKGEEIKGAIADIAGVTNLKVEAQVLVPQVQVRLRPDAAARSGLTPGQVRQAVATLVKGTKVGEVYQEQKVIDVVVRGLPEVRTDLAALRALPIDLPLGGQAPLADVADVFIDPAPNEIKRESASRRLDVTCNVQGRDLGSVARDIEARVKQINFKSEYHPEFLGEYAALQESFRGLMALTALSVIGIVLLLHMDFRSWRLTLLVFLTIFFAPVGGVIATLLQGGILSLGSLVGFVTVLGIAARNGIMLVSHYRHLEEVEGEPFGLNLVLRGAEERLTPILMTALATGLALVPLVVSGNLPGHEIEYPMAVVILGGLTTSTILNLFLLPPIYLLFGRVERATE
jgi:Cu/Ag efflux pump CusA